MRDRGTAGDFGEYNQRVHSSAQRGAQGVLDEGVDSSAQAQGAVHVPSATIILHCTVCSEGSRAEHGGGEGNIEILASDQLPQGDAADWGAGGLGGGHGA